jgi:hypothetical protein
MKYPEVGAFLDLRLLQVDRKGLDLSEQEARKRIAVFVTPGRSLPTVVNAKFPVGHGGWMTFNRSQRKSSPIFRVWRPFSHVNESPTSLTLVLKFDAVFDGEPSCW